MLAASVTPFGLICNHSLRFVNCEQNVLEKVLVSLLSNYAGLLSVHMAFDHCWEFSFQSRDFLTVCYSISYFVHKLTFTHFLRLTPLN